MNGLASHHILPTLLLKVFSALDSVATTIANDDDIQFSRLDPTGKSYNMNFKAEQLLRRLKKHRLNVRLENWSTAASVRSEDLWSVVKHRPPGGIVNMMQDGEKVLRVEDAYITLRELEHFLDVAISFVEAIA